MLPSAGAGAGVQDLPETTFVAGLGDLKGDTLRLPHRFPLGGSELLLLEADTLLPGRDYRGPSGSGVLLLGSEVLHRMAGDGVPSPLVVRYRFFPFPLKERYALREPLLLGDTTGTDSVRMAPPRLRLDPEDIFGRDLRKSGSIVRGLTVGSNRDLSLSSGFRMQLAGALAPDVQVTAALTDENTPIQPEGTTQSLQEFDKVFVELRGPSYAATLGDFNLETRGTEFARVRRKLQGAMGTLEHRAPGGDASLMISGASPRGKFATNAFRGSDGVQGPYRLAGRGGEYPIIVIAGSERVYVDGERQTRGETQDYTVDYALAEITFTVRRLMTAASRVTVDFEYTQRQYGRSLLATQASGSLPGNRGAVSVTVLRESDDPDSPLEFTPDDSALAVLAAAGDDPGRAFLSGVTRVDSGGQYAAVDTMLTGGTAFRFYRYAPGSAEAVYVVSFSRAGPGRGEYVRRAPGQFEWRGPGGGEYLPVRFLPLPADHVLVDLALKTEPLPGFTVTGEFARSSFDANRLSALDDGDNGGHALDVTAAFADSSIRLGGVRLRHVEALLRERFLEGGFVPPDRAAEVEYGRKWGVDSVGGSDEEIREGRLSISPTGSVTVSGGGGGRTQGEEQRSTRLEAAFSLHDSTLPVVHTFSERIASEDGRTNDRSSWSRHRGDVSYRIGRITPGFRLEHEHRAVDSLSGGGSRPGSFAFTEIAPRLVLEFPGAFFLRGELAWRTDDGFLGGRVLRESRALTQTYAARVEAIPSVHTATEVALRTREFAPAFREAGRADARSVVVRHQTRASPLGGGIETDFLYQVSTERASRLERVYVRVAKGTGTHRYLGDLNGNGLADEAEFEQARFDADFIPLSVPSEDTFPIIDLSTGVRLKLQGRRLAHDMDGTAGTAARLLGSETSFRVEEKSTEQDLKQIYLLRFSRFQNEATTLGGSAFFTQDLLVQEGDPAFSARLRFSQRTALNRFSADIERSYVRERSARFRWQLVPEIANQLDLVNRVDALASRSASGRVRDVLANTVSFDFSYRPEQNVETGIRVDLARAEDRARENRPGASINAQSLRVVYALQGAGQARLEAAREETLVAGVGADLPYELTGGRLPGKTWLWKASFEYRVSSFVQATAQYDGRSEGGRAPVHTARAEVRAFF
ncbi:MAG: hypothetical protein WB626_04175 [Bacteroidota bacterium]